ncbi:MAG TPA: hypothetical protein VNZ47_08900 [Candidatus Dormibacteraeota bacterium]|nr:hypothetical protein [Candidatus Dormibacteraeota bacterium]
MTKHRNSVGDSVNPTFDVCAGATVSPGSTTLTFTNHRNSACTLTDDGSTMSLLTLIGQSSISVPAKSGTPPVNGSSSATIQPGAPTGTYTYNASCCPQAGNPQIIYQ